MVWNNPVSGPISNPEPTALAEVGVRERKTSQGWHQGFGMRTWKRSHPLLRRGSLWQQHMSGKEMKSLLWGRWGLRCPKMVDGRRQVGSQMCLECSAEAGEVRTWELCVTEHVQKPGAMEYAEQRRGWFLNVSAHLGIRKTGGINPRGWEGAAPGAKWGSCFLRTQRSKGFSAPVRSGQGRAERQSHPRHWN